MITVRHNGNNWVITKDCVMVGEYSCSEAVLWLLGEKEKAQRASMNAKAALRHNEFPVEEVVKRLNEKEKLDKLVEKLRMEIERVREHGWRSQFFTHGKT